MRAVLYVAYFFHDRALRPRGIIPLLPEHGLRPIVLCRDADPMPRDARMNPAEARVPRGAAVSGDSRPVFVIAPEPLHRFLPWSFRWLRRLRTILSASANSPQPARTGTTPAPRHGANDGVTRTLVEEALAFPDRSAFWIPAAVWKGLREGRRHRVEAIYASSGPAASLVTGSILAALLRRPLVCEFRDLWVDNPFVRYRLPFRRALDRAWEGRILRSSRAVVVVTGPMKAALERAHPWLPKDRIHVIPNGYDPAMLRTARSLAPPQGGMTSPSAPEAAEEDPRRDEEDPRSTGRIPVLTYTGHLYGMRSPRPLLEALERLQMEAGGRAPLRVRFVGRVDERLRPLLARHAERGLVEERGICSYAESLEEMRRADALLLLIENGPGADGIMTGKIFPYLATGKPILALVPPDGVAARLVREAEAGLVADPDSREEVERALRSFLAGDSPRQSAAKRLEALQPYAWPVLAGRVAEVLHTVTGPAPDGSGSAAPVGSGRTDRARPNAPPANGARG